MSEESSSYARWAGSIERRDEVARLSLGEVLVHYMAELDRLEAQRDTIPPEYLGRLAEAIATTRDIVRHGTALEETLRYQWGVVHMP